MESYLGVGVFILVSLCFPIISLTAASFIRPSRPNPEKLSSYECGINAEGEARDKISIHFYIMAMLFVLFDVETAFMFAWAVVYNKIGFTGFIEMALFILILVVGYIYAWKKGALEWD
ncbi:MAG: NADH-quinone oxidoreductase subunit A [Candidatus Firestonebacteria bacterium]|nr:NADH-quinone oxidoreductase subunit A [Candidatus Firestonebacteria bacterium]